MITFEEAKAIALRANNDVNQCSEYKLAYHFSIKDSDAVGDAGVVVMKEDGRAISFVSFILDYQPERRPKRIPFCKK